MTAAFIKHLVKATDKGVRPEDKDKKTEFMNRQTRSSEKHKKKNASKTVKDTTNVVKEQEKMIGALKEKDRVVTTGGILGTITKVKGNIIELKLADNVKIDVLKSSVHSMVNEEK